MSFPDPFAGLRAEIEARYRRIASSTTRPVLTIDDLALTTAEVAEVDRILHQWDEQQKHRALSKHYGEHVAKASRDRIADQGRRWFDSYLDGQLSLDLGGLEVPDYWVREGEAYMPLRYLGSPVFQAQQLRLERGMARDGARLAHVREYALVSVDLLTPGVTFAEVAEQMYRKVHSDS